MCVQHLSRFGLIGGVRAIRDIKKGEELLTDYGYRTPSPKWHQELRKKHIADQNKIPKTSSPLDQVEINM